MSENPNGEEFPELTMGDGPWSYADAPADQEFISFGALKLPALPMMKARIEFDQATRRIGAVTVKVRDCMAQLQVVAAPRGTGAWPNVRRAIARRAEAAQGSTQAVEGHFGTELIATMPRRTADGLPGASTIRFVGVDGDRWTIRCMVEGESALSDDTVGEVNALLSRCAVERGDDAMSAGEVIELSFPAGQIDPDSLPDDDAAAGKA